MPSQDDNEFGRRRGLRGLFSGRGGRAWMDLLGAVLVGNAIYFLLLYPNLPPSWQHRPFVLDLGLVLDFLVCLALYGLARLVQRLV